MDTSIKLHCNTYLFYTDFCQTILRYINTYTVRDSRGATYCATDKNWYDEDENNDSNKQVVDLFL